jgi:hypothetical protein
MSLQPSDNVLAFPALAATPHLVTTFWRMVGPSRYLLTCALFRTTTGLELRAGYDQGAALRWSPIESEAAAAMIAGHLKAAAVRLGNFVDVGPAHVSNHVKVPPELFS